MGERAEAGGGGGVVRADAGGGHAAPDDARGLARKLHRRLIRIYAVSSLSAIGIGGVFFLFGLDLTPTQMRIVLGLVVPFALAPMFVADLKMIRRQLGPIVRFLEALAARGEGADPGAPERGPSEEALRRLAGEALVRALNLPLFTALRVMLVHMPAFGVPAVLFAVFANVAFWLGMYPWQFGVLAVTLLVFSAAHAIYEYFAAEEAIRPVIPMLRAHAAPLAPELGRRIVRLTTRGKLLAISGFVVIVPLAALGVTVLLKLERLKAPVRPGDFPALSAPLYVWVILFVVIASAIAMFMLARMARGVAWQTGELRGAMRRVEEGELGTRLSASSTDEFADVYEGFNRMTAGLQERARLRDAFGRYVAPQIADEVMRGEARMEGVTIQASVLFADIRGFTDMSSRMRPADVVDLLNRYIAAVEPAIRKERGWINKFGGDSILAVFGAPVREPDHATLAVRAALGMREALAVFNAEEKAQSGEHIRIGTGIHCGEMVAGSVGSPERMEYTVIGDVVNVAARIQALNKELGTEILVSAAVREAVGDAFPARALPPAKVQGKAEALRVYTLDPPAADARPEAPLAEAPLTDQAMTAGPS